MNTKVMFSSNSDEWATPDDFFNQLNKEFNFTLDPCCTKQNHKCDKYFTLEDDGLSQDWSGETVFCNPPYSQIAQWVKKAWKEGRKEGRNHCGVAYSSTYRHKVFSQLHL